MSGITGERCGSTAYDGLVASESDLATISEIIHGAIAARVFPGAAVGFGSSCVPCYYQGFGTYTYESSVAVTPESVWDLASLTKVLATTPTLMLLYERGLIGLEEFAYKYLPPEFATEGKNKITIRHLLTHTAGLREWYPFFKMGLITRQQVLDFIMKDKLWYPIDGPARYSDLSMILLGLICERITGLSLDEFVAKEFYKPLGMRDTHFRPMETTDFDPRVVPTEVDKGFRNRLLWGEVHDPTAYLLGGIAGHAGLFSSLKDVCVFAQMLLAGGVDHKTGRRFFRESTMRLFISPPAITSLTNPRPFALGWDVSSRRSADGYTSAGDYTGPRTFGHTGYTGTSIWIDPDRNFFIILLTNAVHPTSECGKHSMKMRDVRPAIANAAVLTFGEQAVPRIPLTWHLGVLPRGFHPCPHSRDWLALPVSATSALPHGRRGHCQACHVSRKSMDPTTAAVSPEEVRGHSIGQWARSTDSAWQMCDVGKPLLANLSLSVPRQQTREERNGEARLSADVAFTSSNVCTAGESFCRSAEESARSAESADVASSVLGSGFDSPSLLATTAAAAKEGEEEEEREEEVVGQSLMTSVDRELAGEKIARRPSFDDSAERTGGAWSLQMIEGGGFGSDASEIDIRLTCQSVRGQGGGANDPLLSDASKSGDVAMTRTASGALSLIGRGGTTPTIAKSVKGGRRRHRLRKGRWHVKMVSYVVAAYFICTWTWW